jgi:hypothetical protein
MVLWPFGFDTGFVRAPVEARVATALLAATTARQRRIEDAVTDRDFDRYDGRSYVGRHPLLSAEEIEQEYREAYRSFYSWRRSGWALATLHRLRGLSLAPRLGTLMRAGR